VRRLLTLSWFFVCVALIAVWTLSPPPAAWVDRFYTGGFYTAVAGLLVPLTGGVALPITVVLLAVILFGVALSVSFRKRRVRGWRALLRRLGRAAVAGVTLYALFIVLWGANYARTPLETRLGLSTGVVPDTLEHVAFAEVLSNVIRQDYDAAPNWDADLAAGRASIARVVEQLEGREVTLPRFVKRTPPGFLLFTGQATGLMVPWTLETYVDRALPYPYQLATALHEAAHVAGYSSEAEADFIAAVAGLTSENASVRYSTALTFFSRSAPLNLLPERYQAIANYLPERFNRDVAALNRAYERYRAPAGVARLQARFYDGYLRSQRVAAGRGDYGRAITLLMAAKRDDVLEFNWEEVLLHVPDSARGRL